MVVPSQTNPSKIGARAARIPPHERATARITPGLELALVDQEPMTIAALEASDQRSFDIRVAGPAALLVAKAIKIGERLEQSETRPDRLKEKDALDAFRLLQAVPTSTLAAGLMRHAQDPDAHPVSTSALELIRREGLSVAGALPRLASSAALGEPTVRRASLPSPNNSSRSSTACPHRLTYLPTRPGARQNRRSDVDERVWTDVDLTGSHGAVR